MRYLTILTIAFTTLLGNGLPETVLADQTRLPEAVLTEQTRLPETVLADKIRLPKTLLADKKIQVDAALATPVMLAEKKQTAYLQVGLIGFRLKKENIAPINVALVIDKSGSMQGDKIRRAKKAANMALDLLRKHDIISVISFDHRVEVLLPATKATDKEIIHKAINRLRAGGSTALFDGVKKGAQEVRKFLEKDRVNRIILVSDGKANVGPDSPQELGNLGASLGKEGIAVTTLGLGLGYHEDLMAQLAEKSDGNHAFIENATDLARIFKYEFGDLFTVVATDVNITITCAEGIRPVRVLGREADIQGQQVQIVLNQLYSEHQKNVLLEIEVPSTKADQKLTLAKVKTVYRNMVTDSTDSLTNQVTATFTTSAQRVEEETNAAVMVTALEQLALEKNELAIKLRDRGKVTEARQVLLDNAARLKKQAKKYKSELLEKLSDLNRNDAQNLEDWRRQRKIMRGNIHKRRNYQTY
jgi:Ca-activated chloride channel family protein